MLLNSYIFTRVLYTYGHLFSKIVDLFMNLPTTTYKFADYLLDRSKRTLFFNGVQVKLRDRDFDLLVFLIERAPEICSFDEIIESVWNGTNVENNSVEKAIAAIRNVLGDNAKDPQLIKTIRAKGYFFAADVESLVSGPDRAGYVETPFKGSVGDAANHPPLSGSKKIFPYTLLLILGILMGVLVAASYFSRLNSTPIANSGRSDYDVKIPQTSGILHLQNCQNILRNGDFENGLEDWDIVNFTPGATAELQKENRNAYIKLIHEGERDWSAIGQEVRSKLQVGDVYVFSFKYKIESNLSVGIRFADSQMFMHSSVVNERYGWNRLIIGDESWRQDSFEFMASASRPKSDEPLFNICFEYNNIGYILIDDVLIAPKTSGCRSK